MADDNFLSDGASIQSVRSVNPSVDTLASERLQFGKEHRSTQWLNFVFAPELTKRLRAMTLTLLPLEVEPSSINDPTSRIITPQVISAYKAAAGDFTEAVSSSSSSALFSLIHEECIQLPYCLLRARQQFMFDANRNVADFDENQGRGTVFPCRAVHAIYPLYL